MNIINCILNKNYKELKNKLEKNDEDINALTSSGNTFFYFKVLLLIQQPIADL
jgi:hypothetical protein